VLPSEICSCHNRFTGISFDARVGRGAKIEGDEMVFWRLQDQFQQDPRPLFSCFGKRTFAAKEAPKEVQFEN
jgi:hypothetical protein